MGRIGLMFGAALASATVIHASDLGFSYHFTSCKIGSQTAFGIGDTTHVCLNINGKVTSIFNVVTDTFQAINIVGSNIDFPGSGYMEDSVGWVTEIAANASVVSTFYSTFDIAAGGVFAPFPKIYKRIKYTPTASGFAPANIETLPLYTVIIKMDTGVVTDIGWDDGCFFCAENTDECMHNSFSVNSSTEISDDTYRGCRKATDECYPETFTNAATNSTNSSSSSTNVTLTTSDCDLKIFVTWTGTDKSGQYLRSASKRFSRYRAFGIATAYQSAVNLANEGLDIANSAIDGLKQIPNQIVRINAERRLSSVDTANSDHVGPSYFGAGYGSYRAESDRSNTAAENAALHAEEALMNRERWQEEERKFLQQASAVAAGETVAASGHLRSAKVERQQQQPQ